MTSSTHSTLYDRYTIALFCPHARELIDCFWRRYACRSEGGFFVVLLVLCQRVLSRARLQDHPGGTFLRGFRCRHCR